MKVFGISMAVIFGIIAVGVMSLVGIYNRFPTHEAAVQASWARVQSAYKLRADLIVNMANVAEKYMSEEQKLVIGNAKARAGNAVLPENATPEQIQKFQEAQAAMRAAVTVVRETTPTSRGDTQFLQLQKKMSDTENMIRARRDEYVREVQGYNLNVTRFPSSLVASWGGFKAKPQLAFEDAETIKNAPTVFGK